MKNHSNILLWLQLSVSKVPWFLLITQLQTQTHNNINKNLSARLKRWLFTKVTDWSWQHKWFWRTLNNKLLHTYEHLITRLRRLMHSPAITSSLTTPLRPIKRDYFLNPSEWSCHSESTFISRVHYISPWQPSNRFAELTKHTDEHQRYDQLKLELEKILFCHEEDASPRQGRMYSGTLEKVRISLSRFVPFSSLLIPSQRKRAGDKVRKATRHPLESPNAIRVIFVLAWQLKHYDLSSFILFASTVEDINVPFRLLWQFNCDYLMWSQLLCTLYSLYNDF